jgi:putative ABC transport system permease protein
LMALVPGLPRAGQIEVNLPVLTFAMAISLMTGLVFGLVPALQATRFDLRDALNEEGRGSSSGLRHNRMRNALVVAEVALALMLLIGAGLMLRSFAALQDKEPGFEVSNLLVVDMPLSPTTYREDLPRTTAVERVIERILTIPGVVGAAAATGLPMSGAGATIHFNIAGKPPKGPEEYRLAGYRAVTPAYFDVMRIPIVRGRALDERDRQGAPLVAVINESMARQHFADVDPMGQRFAVGTEADAQTAFIEIVGVAGDVMQSFETGSNAEYYLPYGQYPDPVLAGMYLQTTLLIIFAVVAAALAIIGVYGVMAYAVSHRTQEIGVRIALGASRRDVVTMVVRQGVVLTVIGIALGLGGAVIATRALESLLFATDGLDPATFGAAALTLAAASTLASYIPARRAARVAPIIALQR